MNFGYHFRIITNNSGQLVKYLTIESELSAIRGQMLYRSKNLGMKELDLIVGSWAVQNISKLNKTELLNYNSQVLKLETPQLNRKVLGYAVIEPDEHYVRQIRQFALNQKYSKIDL